MGLFLIPMFVCFVARILKIRCTFSSYVPTLKKCERGLEATKMQNFIFSWNRLHPWLFINHWLSSFQKDMVFFSLAASVYLIQRDMDTRIQYAVQMDEKSVMKEVLQNIRFFVTLWQGIKMMKVNWEIAVNMMLPIKIFKTQLLDAILLSWVKSYVCDMDYCAPTMVGDQGLLASNMEDFVEFVMILCQLMLSLATLYFALSLSFFSGLFASPLPIISTYGHLPRWYCAPVMIGD